VPLRVVYFGTPGFAVAPLEALAGSQQRIAAVYTQPDRPAGRGRHARPSAVKTRALELSLELRQPADLKGPQAAAEFAALAPDVAIVAAYGLLLPQAMLDVPRFGCLNIHASLLPRWRGAAPVQRAILAGDQQTGVAIMRMEAGLDTGPLYAVERTAIGATETATELGARLAAIGARLLLEVLGAVEAGRAQAVPQAREGATYAHKLDKREAPIDWTRDAPAIDRQVRALQPWPVAETTWRGAQLKVHAARAIAGPSAGPPGVVVAAGREAVTVATGDGGLELLRVQLPGRGVVTAGEFIAAESRRGALLGARLGGVP
jgi:methionyl-tRNA formyltransferase